MTTVRHLRFAPSLRGEERQQTLTTLRSLGVMSLKPAFPGSPLEQRAGVYVIGLAENADRKALDEYLSETKDVIPLDAQAMETIEQTL